MELWEEAANYAYIPPFGKHHRRNFRVYTNGHVSTGYKYYAPDGFVGKCVFVQGGEAVLEFADKSRVKYPIGELKKAS